MIDLDLKHQRTHDTDAKTGENPLVGLVHTYLYTHTYTHGLFFRLSAGSHFSFSFSHTQLLVAKSSRCIPYSISLEH